jgi:sensor histidine kinase regulating citrate/malate metabolism
MTDNYKDIVFKTTKADKENHGYGLKIINGIIKKYNGVMDINNTRDKVKMEIRFL